MVCTRDQIHADWDQILAWEDYQNELYFGEVYRQILTEAWLPAGSNPWYRATKSRRDRRPTAQGLGATYGDPSQRDVRNCFSKCKDNWNLLLWDYPPDSLCSDVWDKKWWYEEKQVHGVKCSYYDLYMRYCMNGCLATDCVPSPVVCMKFSPDPPTYVTPGSTYTLNVQGGAPPFNWSLYGPRFSLSPPDTTLRTTTLCVDEDATGFANISVTDACGLSLSHNVYSEEGGWLLIGEREPHPWAIVCPDSAFSYRDRIFFVSGDCAEWHMHQHVIYSYDHPDLGYMEGDPNVACNFDVYPYCGLSTLLIYVYI